MTVDFFSLHHSRTLFDDARSETEGRIAKAADTGQMIVAALFDDFGSQNGRDWALVANILTCLQKFGPL